MNRKFLLLPLFFSITACATKSDLNSALQDIEEMKTRLVQTEKTVSGIKVEAKEIAENNSKAALKNLDTVRKGTADMQANLDSMRIDVQVLAGKVDDLGLVAKKPFDDIALLKEDASKSLGALDERVKKLEAEVEKLAALAKSLEHPPTAENVYKQAFDVFKGGDTAKAREMFNKFTEQFPDNALSANARYWVGETYFMEKNYEQAVLEFQRVIKEYPGKGKVPAAMLKQGLAFKELGDAKSARFIVKELIEKFPTSEEIPAAKDFLQKLK